MGLSSVVSGLISNGNSLPTIDIRPLLDTINTAGANQRSLINALPVELRKQLEQYATSMEGGAAKYQSALQALGGNLKEDTSKLYGPDSEASKLALTAAKKEAYSTVPGTQNAIRNALAATGGLSRGQAGVSLAQPYMQAATDYSKASSGILADQAKMGQQAQMKALETVASMEDTMFQNLFGMSKEQAKQILSSGNAALSDQLAQLIAQSNNQANQTLGAQGLAINNGYQNAVTRNAQQNAIWSGLSDMAIDGAMHLPMPGGAGAGGAGGAPISGVQSNFA